MNIFVTGGAGYVGSHCVKRLLDGEHRVTVFDNLVAGHRQALDERADFVKGDLGSSAAIQDALSATKFDAVMHFAAFLEVGESVREPLKYYRNNVCNAVNLLEAMKRGGIRKIVFSSTCAVYGEPEDSPITEDMLQQPINPYGRTKLAIEWMLRDSATAWGLGSVALRYFNAAGAAADGSNGEWHQPETHLIPLVLQVALGQRDVIKVFGNDYPTPDGSCVRDYIHVEDLAEVHARAVEGINGSDAESYNVGTGVGQSVFDVIKACRDVTGHAIPHEVTPRRPGDPPTLYANPAKLKRRYSWDPTYGTIAGTVETAWRWHNAHPNGFE
ncbi:MAG: UDP-glucose 4-epimerase GalE [Planctomycetes bacterium]|nr:UDP-glucose 4-epimerase GalE [Planctomycetota bacterium]